MDQLIELLVDHVEIFPTVNSFFSLVKIREYLHKLVYSLEMTVLCFGDPFILSLLSLRKVSGETKLLMHAVFLIYQS